MCCSQRHVGFVAILQLRLTVLGLDSTSMKAISLIGTTYLQVLEVSTVAVLYWSLLCCAQLDSKRTSMEIMPHQSFCLINGYFHSHLQMLRHVAFGVKALTNDFRALCYCVFVLYIGTEREESGCLASHLCVKDKFLTLV